MKHAVTLEVTDEVLAGLGLSPTEFEHEARLLLAAKLYEQGRLSSGQAAALCGLGRVAFLMTLPTLGVALSNLRADDGEDEIAFARRG